MFGISFGELVIIALVALVLFGPDRLPELARSAGKFMANFSQTLESVQQEFNKGVQDAEKAAQAVVEDAPDEAKPSLDSPKAGDGDDPVQTIGGIA